MSEEEEENPPCAPCDDCGMHVDCCGEPHDAGMCVYLGLDEDQSDEEPDDE